MTTRRNFIAGAAATAAGLTPLAASAAADPFLTARADYLSQRATWEAAVERYSEAEKSRLAARPNTAAYAIAAAREDVAEAEVEETSAAYHTALDRLLLTAPTTAAGTLALLDVLALEFECDEPKLGPPLTHLRAILAAQA